MSKNADNQRVNFEALLKQCADKAYNFAFRLCGNGQQACDLVQEAFARGFEHRDRYDPSRPFDAWINRILHNVFIDHVRRYETKNTISYDAQISSDEEHSWVDLLSKDEVQPIDALIKEESERALQKALNRLPIHYKSALILFDIEGKSYEEIGKIMGVPVGTVGSRINQGRHLLRKALENIDTTFKTESYEQSQRT